MADKGIGISSDTIITTILMPTNLKFSAKMFTNLNTSAPTIVKGRKSSSGRDKVSTYHIVFNYCTNIIWLSGIT